MWRGRGLAGPDDERRTGSERQADQYDRETGPAARTAEDHAGTAAPTRLDEQAPRPTAIQGAIAGASAVVLTYLYQADSADFEAEVRAREAALEPGRQAGFRTGEAIGRRIGAKAVELARSDRFNTPWTGTVPTGPGMWYSSTTPAAKFTYWLLRPTQADPAISLAIGLPNFPSYPSNHGCFSGAAAYVLGALFPGEEQRLARMACDAAISRVFGGIHYRFDGDVGLQIGRNITELALGADRQGSLLQLLR